MGHRERVANDLVTLGGVEGLGARLELARPRSEDGARGRRTPARRPLVRERAARSSGTAPGRSRAAASRDGRGPRVVDRVAIADRRRAVGVPDDLPVDLGDQQVPGDHESRLVLDRRSAGSRATGSRRPGPRSRPPSGGRRAAPSPRRRGTAGTGDRGSLAHRGASARRSRYPLVSSWVLPRPSAAVSIRARWQRSRSRCPRTASWPGSGSRRRRRAGRSSSRDPAGGPATRRPTPVPARGDATRVA